MRYARGGVTLIEMLIVVSLIGLMAGITFPSVSSGLDTLRLNQATGDVVNFFNEALNRAERREQAVEITIPGSGHSLAMRSPESGFEKKVELPRGISIVNVLPPEVFRASDAPRSVMVYPGGVAPRIGVELVNSRGVHRTVRVDPMTGVPQIDKEDGK